jgi:hypothetical protein
MFDHVAAVLHDGSDKRTCVPYRMRTVGLPGVVGTSSDAAVLGGLKDGCILLLGFKYNTMSVMTSSRREP